MPNLVKYNTSTESSSLRKGNFYLGVGDVGKGPTSETGFWNGYDEPSGGYVIYLNKNSGGPSIYTASSDEDLISMVNRISNSSFTTIAQALDWAAGQVGAMIVNKQYPPIITDGLVINLDSSFTPSYPRTGTSWYDTSIRANNSSLINGTNYVSETQVMSFDGTDDYITIPHTAALTSEIFSQTRFATLESTVNVAVFQNWTCMINQAFGASYSNTTGPGLWSNSSGYQFVVGTGVNSNPSGGSRTLSFTALTNRWYHIVGTINGTDMRMYVNGNLHESTTTSINTIQSNNQPVVIGRRSTGSTPSLNGEIASVRAYNRPLTLEEVRQNYYQAPIVTESIVFGADAGNLVSFEPGQTTAYYLADNSFSGTLTNGVGYSSANGGKWVFDGVNDYLFFSGTPNSLEGNPNFTVCGFFRRTEASLVGSGFWGIGGSATAAGINNWNSSSTNQITIDMWGTSTFTTGQTYPLNEWVFVAWQKTAGNMTRANCTIWVNSTSYTGNQLSIIRAEGGAPNINDLGVTIGAINNSTTYPSGVDIGCIYIYDRVLTSGEILQNFNAQRSRFGI